jgi:hypothetical protein
VTTRSRKPDSAKSSRVVRLAAAATTKPEGGRLCASEGWCVEPRVDAIEVGRIEVRPFHRILASDELVSDPEEDAALERLWGH